LAAATYSGFTCPGCAVFESGQTRSTPKPQHILFAGSKTAQFHQEKQEEEKEKDILRRPCQQQQQKESRKAAFHHQEQQTDMTAEGLHHRGPHAADPDQQHDHLSSSSTQQHPADVEAAISPEPAGSKGSHKDVGSDEGAAGNTELQQQPEQYADVTYADIFKQFSILGWTAFGGPAAHIGLFQRVSSSSSTGRPPALLCCAACRSIGIYNGRAIELPQRQLGRPTHVCTTDDSHLPLSALV
jgi:hypothetical protein